MRIRNLEKKLEQLDKLSSIFKGIVSSTPIDCKPCGAVIHMLSEIEQNPSNYQVTYHFEDDEECLISEPWFVIDIVEIDTADKIQLRIYYSKFRYCILPVGVSVDGVEFKINGVTETGVGFYDLMFFITSLLRLEDLRQSMNLENSVMGNVAQNLKFKE